jgi:hypothetical protein
MGGVCSIHGKTRNAYSILIRLSEGKRSLGRPRHRWEYSIKVSLKECAC